MQVGKLDIITHAGGGTHGFNREDDSLKISTVGHTGINACGDRVRPGNVRQWSLKQESHDFSCVECQVETIIKRWEEYTGEKAVKVDG